MSEGKADAVQSLAKLNAAVLGKLDGVGEYDLRRPMTRTGSNLLGIVKHLASVQAGYFGDVFGRPWPEAMPWISDESSVNEDMFATADESTDWVRAFYQRSWVHATETFAVTDLDDRGTVEWWAEDVRHPTLRRVLLHMTIETARHAGQIDVLRELIDGEAGRMANDPGIPGDDFDWPGYVATVDAAARQAAG